MAPKKTRRAGDRFVKVNARLFAEDVAQIKAQAEAEGDLGGWQVRLRRLVHDALRARRILQ